MKAKVLLVEDDPSLMIALRDGFDDEGYAVEAATDGVAALAAATSVAPDIVILDVMLPGIAGTEVCRRLRAAATEPPRL